MRGCASFYFGLVSPGPMSPQTKLAYTHCQARCLELSVPFIAEAYMTLLASEARCAALPPPPGPRDDLVHEYGAALRHMVDATWAFICRARLDVNKERNQTRQR